jgi:hypothetical protein
VPGRTAVPIPFAVTDIDMPEFLAVDKKAMLLEAFHLLDFYQCEAGDPWHTYLTILNA